MPGYPLLPGGIIPNEPLNDSYAVKLGANYLRSDYTQGMPRQARKYRRGFTAFAIRWPMTPEQYEIFIGFLEDACGGLGNFFDCMVFRGDSYERMSIRMQMPLPDVTREGGEWMLSHIAETTDYRPRDGVTTAAAMLTYGSDMELGDLVELLEHSIRVDLAGALS